MKKNTLTTARSPILKKASSGDRMPTEHVQIVNLAQSKSTNYYASLAKTFKTNGTTIGT